MYVSDIRTTGRVSRQPRRSYHLRFEAEDPGAEAARNAGHIYRRSKFCMQGITVRWVDIFKVILQNGSNRFEDISFLQNDFGPF